MPLDHSDPRLPVDERVRRLLADMTVDEKVAQLRSMRMGPPQLTREILADESSLDELLRHGLGMLNPEFDVSPRETIEKRNIIERHLRTRTRLGIPVLILDEAHHGLLAPDVDVFPHGLALASSWDIDLLERIFETVARQVRARGGHMALSPVVDVVRDPRWGRTGETFGEDPYLCGVLGAAVVRGLGRGGIAATLKHLTGHGAPEGGLNQAPANHSTRMLLELHMEPFRICIERSKPRAVMPSYCDIDGVPSHANAWVLQDVLRDEWGFDGLVVSDWFGIDHLWNKHHVEACPRDAALRAFTAGVAVDLPHGTNYAHLVQMVSDRVVSKLALNDAVARVLAVKFELGIFDAPDIDAGGATAFVGTSDVCALAREAAVESMVLLKNEGGLLPINPTQYDTIAVIGPCAAVNYLGDYSGVPRRNVTLLDGIRAKLGAHVRIRYAQGVRLTSNGTDISRRNYQHALRAEFPSDAELESMIAEAVRVAQSADLVIVAIGENEQLSRESGDPARYGDVCSLELVSRQTDLVQALVATGKPVVAYLMHARPLAINWMAEHVPAIVDGWYAGEEAGAAFTDLLVGDANFSGKLAISYPRSAGHIPACYNHKPSARDFEYVEAPSCALYPFGHGLSYTNFV